jgi:hypothetical protein
VRQPPPEHDTSACLVCIELAAQRAQESASVASASDGLNADLHASDADSLTGDEVKAVLELLGAASTADRFPRSVVSCVAAYGPELTSAARKLAQLPSKKPATMPDPTPAQSLTPSDAGSSGVVAGCSSQVEI